VLPPELRIDAEKLTALLAEIDPEHPHLFAFPAQSNFSGVKHSLDWIEKAQSLGWDVLLDAAAFAPTNRLDLHDIRPDFVTLSFYKIFGYPTGVGCLIAKKSALGKLHRPWFAGGTITVASVQADRHYLEEGESGFEDGTINYLNLPAIEIGLKHIERVGIEAIGQRVTALSGWLIGQLCDLRHSNGAPLVTIYGPANTDMRGGTVTINFYDDRGRLIDYNKVEALANGRNISLRTGCFCNPGASEKALGLTREELDACFAIEERMTFEQFMAVISSGRDEEAVGAVRVSVGIATNFADVYQFTQFARTFLT
jgi:selenocysteine lyase/cysteine desulfurase